VAALVLLSLAGHELVPLPFTVASWVSWLLFGILALGALMNLASRSRWERFLMSPIALVLSLLCLVVALEG
jgi:fumarate reductase subunit C